MFRLETVNELSLRATCDDGQGRLYTKAGAFIAGSGGFKFTKMLLGPGGNPVQALAGQILRRLTGENMPLMEVHPQGQSVTYYANLAQHVTVIDLQPGMSLNVESESLLAFNDACRYSARFYGQGMISQGGMFITKLTAIGHGAQVAVLSDGNPLVLPTPCRIDPDAIVCFTGSDPGFKLDVGFRNLIGQHSGESYQFDFTQPGGQVVLQPSERKSGLDISIDGRNTGRGADVQNNQSISGGVQNIGNAASQIGNIVGGLFR